MTDVSDADAVDALARATLDRFGAVHVVCNNAGVGGGGLAWQVPAPVWDWIVGVNLFGVVHGIRSFVPHLIAQEEGHVVNTASVAGLLGSPGLSPYCATKHAVVGLSEALAHDLDMVGSPVGVSVLCPGYVRTRIAEADRNWPARYGPPPGTDGQPGRTRCGRPSAGRSSPGSDPAVVAEAVRDAIVASGSWILDPPRIQRRGGGQVPRGRGRRRSRIRPPGLSHDRREPLPGGVELAEDAGLGLVGQRRVGTGDQFREDRDQRRVLPGQPGQAGPVVWIRPTPLSVKSEALMTRAHGWRPGSRPTCSRYRPCRSGRARTGGW